MTIDLDALRALVAKATPGPLVQSGRAMLLPSGDMLAMFNLAMNVDECHANVALAVAAVNALPALLDELASARRDAEDIRRAGEILADAPGLPLELLDEKELSKWTDAITGLVILFTDAIDAARGER